MIQGFFDCKINSNSLQQSRFCDFQASDHPLLCSITAHVVFLEHQITSQRLRPKILLFYYLLLLANFLNDGQLFVGMEGHGGRVAPLQSPVALRNLVLLLKRSLVGLGDLQPKRRAKDKPPEQKNQTAKTKKMVKKKNKKKKKKKEKNPFPLAGKWTADRKREVTYLSFNT
jgi:hypothetical protein